MSDPRLIFNWLEIDDRVSSSGQPTAAELEGLRDLVVTTVVNLAPHDHEKALADEAGIVARLGLRYIHIPVDFAAPREADFVLFRDAMALLGDERIHVHCIVNARVTAFLYRYRRDILGIAEAEARRMMDRVWRPGGVWARFIGDERAATEPHRYIRRDYQAG